MPVRHARKSNSLQSNCWAKAIEKHFNCNYMQLRSCVSHLIEAYLRFVRLMNDVQLIQFRLFPFAITKIVLHNRSKWLNGMNREWINCISSPSCGNQLDNFVWVRRWMRNAYSQKRKNSRIINLTFSWNCLGDMCYQKHSWFQRMTQRFILGTSLVLRTYFTS